MATSVRDEQANAVLAAYELAVPGSLTWNPVPVNPGEIVEETTAAWNFLVSAATSVENALTAASRQRSVRLAYEGKAPGGRLSEADQDLLRAALIFAGAGLDATLKRLLEDCLIPMTRLSSQARSAFQDFAHNALSRDIASGDPTLLVETLIGAPMPRQVLQRKYLDSLTGGSLQSASSVKRVAAALGVEDRDFFRRVDDKPGRLLHEMFRARNQMIHELDLRNPTKSTLGAASHRRETREIGKIRSWASEALSVALYVVQAVNAQLAAQNANTPS